MKTLQIWKFLVLQFRDLASLESRLDILVRLRRAGSGRILTHPAPKSTPDKAQIHRASRTRSGHDEHSLRSRNVHSLVHVSMDISRGYGLLRFNFAANIRNHSYVIIRFSTTSWNVVRTSQIKTYETGNLSHEHAEASNPGLSDP